jgi:hypothetical protein
MANGATVRLPCTHEISAAAQLFDPQLGSAEGWVGAIVTELADVAVSAVREIEADGLTAGTRLQEFAAAVHRVVRTRRGAPLSAAVIDDVIEIVTEVAVQAGEMN